MPQVSSLALLLSSSKPLEINSIEDSNGEHSGPLAFANVFASASQAVDENRRVFTVETEVPSEIVGRFRQAGGKNLPLGAISNPQLDNELAQTQQTPTAVSPTDKKIAAGGIGISLIDHTHARQNGLSDSAATRVLAAQSAIGADFSTSKAGDATLQQLAATTASQLSANSSNADKLPASSVSASPNRAETQRLVAQPDSLDRLASVLPGEDLAPSEGARVHGGAGPRHQSNSSHLTGLSNFQGQAAATQQPAAISAKSPHGITPQIASSAAEGQATTAAAIRNGVTADLQVSSPSRSDQGAALAATLTEITKLGAAGSPANVSEQHARFSSQILADETVSERPSTVATTPSTTGAQRQKLIASLDQANQIASDKRHPGIIGATTPIAQTGNIGNGVQTLSQGGELVVNSLVSDSTNNAQSPSSVSQHAPKLNFGDPAFRENFVQQLVTMSQNGVQHARMNLNPAELGPLEVRLSLAKDDVAVQLATQNVGVKEAIEEALPRLRELFDQAGLKLAQYSVSSDLPQRGSPHEGFAAEGQFARETSDLAEEASPNQERSAEIPQGLVDTYV